MNKNGRNSYDDRGTVRPTNRNNINILINFNMKDKNQTVTGKKIDNYIQVEPKSTAKVENYQKRNEEGKKAKKKESTEKQEKGFDTPLKQKQFQRNKNNKIISEKTPEKKSQEKKQERSKSTNQKLVKRKNAKSMENIKTGIRITRNRENFPQISSAERSRSHSKSSQKILRSHDHSLKNLFAFTNSGIKNKIKNERVNQSRQRQISSMSKKVNKQQDHEKIKKYMEEKKKKIKIEKNKQIKEQKSKKQKQREQLKKVEAQRKANASKPLSISKNQFFQKEERLPIYCQEEDQFNQSNQYDTLNKEANQMIHQSPPPSDPMKSIPIARSKDFQKGTNSHKRTNKSKKICLVHTYLNGTITEKKLRQLEDKLVKIQSVWRGYICRKQFLKKLSDEAIRFRYIKNKFDNKRGALWNQQQEDNSIINVQRDSTVKIYQSGSSSINYINFNSNPQSEISNQQYRIVNDIKDKTDKFKKLSIDLEEEGESQQGSKMKSQKQTYENSKMLRQIEELRKMLEKQNEKYKSLEQQNEHLKENIKHLSLKESQEIKSLNSADLINSNDFIEIRMPKKIESPPNLIKVQESQQSDTSSRNIKQNSLKQSTNQEKAIDFNSFKKQFQAFQCSSPSNARLQEQLKHLKGKNIQNVFLKKQIKIQKKYEKKAQMFDKMLNDKVFSPRTYSAKKKQLEIKLKDQKEEVKQRILQAKRIVGYIEDISSEQQSQKEMKSQQSQKNQELNLRTASLGILQIKPNFKKQKQVKDISVNTSPLQIKQVPFKPIYNPNPYLRQQKKQNRSDSDYSSQQEKVYKKYWTDDIEEVHKHTLQITKKIQEALKAESSQSSNRNKLDQLHRQHSNDDYHSQQFHSCQSNKQGSKQIQIKKSQHGYSKSSDVQVNLQSLKQSYEDYLEEIRQLPTEPEKKARQIFNKIDFSTQNECKSEDQMESSHDNICQLLNQRPLHTSPQNDQKKEGKNLYITEAQFNKKKRKQEELSKSSSFQKSNKSFSANNSQLQCKGFITNLTFIKQFCISVCEFIRNNEHYRQLFVQNISQSIKHDQFQLLRSYRVTIGGEVKNSYNTFQDQYVYPYFNIIASKNNAITHELFNDFMKIYDEEKSSNVAWNDPSINKKTKQMREFFLVSIIDTFNQSLQYEKPGSIYGEPLPWLNTSKYLKNYRNTSLKILNNIQRRYSSDSSDFEEQNEQEKKMDQIFGASIAKIIQWGSCLCGFIADPMPMEMGDSQIANLSDEQLNSIRQNRVGLMLEKWLLQQEEHMTNSTAEYTQVLLYLGEKIIESLLVECTDQILELHQ